MSDLTIVLISLVVACLSLVIVSYINGVQTRRRLINGKFNELKRRASELVELGAYIEPLIESPKVLIILNEEVIAIIELMRQLIPDSPFIEIGTENAQFRADELTNTSYRVETYRLMESDAAIARAQAQLNDAAIIIRQRQAKGLLEVAEMDLLIGELSWAHLMVSVVTMIGQGHKAVNRGDVLRAHAFYKKALESATLPGYKDERQNQFITEIGELMSNKRRYLSAEIMPETTFNPK